MSWHITSKVVAEGVVYGEPDMCFIFYESGLVFIQVQYPTAFVNTQWTGRAVDLDELVVYDSFVFNEKFYMWED